VTVDVTSNSTADIKYKKISTLVTETDRPTTQTHSP